MNTDSPMDLLSRLEAEKKNTASGLSTTTQETSTTETTSSQSTKTQAEAVVSTSVPEPTAASTAEPTSVPTARPTAAPTPSKTTAAVGDTIIFGKYEQDNNTKNGKEDIEWIVLAKDETKALIISKYALDCQPFHTSPDSTTWETCSLRKWLNWTFLNAAFSSEKQSRIVSKTVTADANPLYDTSPGNKTTDAIFLLSMIEVSKYFSSDEARKCSPTDYAIARGSNSSSSYSTGGGSTCSWWLRSPGSESYYAVFVFQDGSIYDTGFYVSHASGAVRPALWLDLA